MEDTYYTKILPLGTHSTLYFQFLFVWIISSPPSLPPLPPLPPPQIQYLEPTWPSTVSVRRFWCPSSWSSSWNTSRPTGWTLWVSIDSRETPLPSRNWGASSNKVREVLKTNLYDEFSIRNGFAKQFHMYFAYRETNGFRGHCEVFFSFCAPRMHLQLFFCEKPAF